MLYEVITVILKLAQSLPRNAPRPDVELDVELGQLVDHIRVGEPLEEGLVERARHAVAIDQPDLNLQPADVAARRQSACVEQRAQRPGLLIQAARNRITSYNVCYTKLLRLDRFSMLGLQRDHGFHRLAAPRVGRSDDAAFLNRVV